VIRRLLKRPLLAALLALTILPGWPELLENVEHLLHDGHLAHSAQHDDVAANEGHDDVDEHGCSPMAHQCPCHVSMQAVLTARQDADEDTLGLDEVRGFTAPMSPQERAIPPPKRPPIG
jgi:hypothetical protein